VKEARETIEKCVKKTWGRYGEDMKNKRGSLKQLMNMIEAIERGTQHNRVR
jgi:hypothetical protein